MTISVTTISNNQTFGTWLTTTNRLADIVTQNTVTSDATTGGSVTTGNSFVNGHFGSNFLYVANTLSGGNVSSNGVLRIQANVAVFTGSSNLLIVTANGTTTAVSLSSNTISLAAQNNVAISGALLSVTSTNTTFSGLVDIGNTSSNVSISGGTLTINGTNVNTAITSNAATAYTNATSFATSAAATAYSNATSFATSAAATAYSNAITYSANATNISSGTLSSDRLSGTYNITANNANYANASFSNTFTIGTSGYFVANGNLGIGTSSPASPLHIVGDVRLSSINNGPLAGFRNTIINGNFDIWQRGTSITGVSFDQFLADRWYHVLAGTTANVSRQAFTVGQTDVPGEPTYFHRTDVTSVAGSSNYCALGQKIEFVRTFAGQTATLSFWAKADASKNIAVEFQQNFGTGGTPSSDVFGNGVNTFALTTSWQKFTATVNIPSISGKTLGTNNNDSLIMLFWFDAGSTLNSRTNSLGQQSGTFDIAQVQLEASPVATPFERRPIGTELALCQRYYCVTRSTVRFYSSTTEAHANHVYFPVEMRDTPTVTRQSTVSERVNVDASYPLASNITTTGFTVTVLSTGGTRESYDNNRLWTAAIEL